MLETFNSRSSRDFRQRYENTYGWFTNPETKKKTLVYLTSVGEESISFKDAKSISYSALADVGVEFEFLPVTKKLFFYGDNIYYIHRRPARQWQRGVSLSNTSIVDLKTKERTTLTFNRVMAAFETDVPDPVVQFARYMQGKRTTALLSDLFAIVDGQLYVYDTCIGKIDIEQKKVLLEQHIFRQEVIDLLTKLNIAFIVETV